MKNILTKSFFERPALEVCPELLGKYLVRKNDENDLALMITEIEAYDGPEDKACHARFGQTKRNAAMFGPAGHWYIYLCYGMYWMLNIVVDREDYPAAILIRGTQDVSGPGRLTRALKIDDSLNSKPSTLNSELWIEDRAINVPTRSIQRTPRIGIDYAEEWKEKPYRFLLS